MLSLLLSLLLLQWLSRRPAPARVSELSESVIELSCLLPQQLGDGWSESKS